MATLGSKLITSEMEWNANMTEQNHLGKALLARPEKLIGKMNQLFSAQNYYSDNPITGMLFGGKKSEIEIGTTSWEWELKGANTRPLVVVENVLPISDTTPGKFGRTYKIKLDENWFLEGDVLNPGTANKRYQSRVLTAPQRHGEGWVYTVKFMSDDNNLFLPVQYLRPGTAWSKLYSLYGEAAKQSGSTQFSLPITLQSRTSLFRKKYMITNYASTEVLAVALPDSEGKLHQSWMKYAEVEYWMQWYKELERGAWYTRSNSTTKDANGRPVRSGPGIQELLEDSHVQRFTHLTARLIEDYLTDIFYSRVKPGKGRHVKGYTGEYGMIIFHRAVMDWMNKTGFIKNVEVFTNKVSSDYNGNALEAGFQFVRYVMANGAVLELIHNPLNDDREINAEIDSVTGYPLESQRITFLDFAGETSKDSNIKIVNKKDGLAFTYIEGLYGPYGPKKGGSSAHSGSYYEMHVEKTTGVQITDITKCGELILSRN